MYELENANGRKSYKIFTDGNELLVYLKNNKDKKCINNKALYQAEKYIAFSNTQVRKLSQQEVEQYLEKRKYK